MVSCDTCLCGAWRDLRLSCPMICFGDHLGVAQPIVSRPVAASSQLAGLGPQSTVPCHLSGCGCAIPCSAPVTPDVATDRRGRAASHRAIARKGSPMLRPRDTFSHSARLVHGCHADDRRAGYRRSANSLKIPTLPLDQTFARSNSSTPRVDGGVKCPGSEENYSAVDTRGTLI